MCSKGLKQNDPVLFCARGNKIQNKTPRQCILQDWVIAVIFRKYFRILQQFHLEHVSAFHSLKRKLAALASPILYEIVSQ